MKPLQPRNPHAVAARFRKAGTHTSTDKRRGGKRGGSRSVEEIEQLLEHEEEHENSGEDQE